jgi:hemerythrin-like domain-containing protein
MNSRVRGVETLSEALAFEDEHFSYSDKGQRRKANGDAGALPDIIDTLYSEHRYIHSLLDTLEQQVSRLVPGKIADYKLLLDIVDYLTHYPDQYHHPREDLLFDALLRNDRNFRKQLQRLKREHETLRKYNGELFDELSGIVAGRRVSQSELRATLDRYVTGYRKHMNFESREIFPLGKGKLTAAELSKLNAKTRYIDDPIFGSSVEQQYSRLARNLQSRLGNLGNSLEPLSDWKTLANDFP